MVVATNEPIFNKKSTLKFQGKPLKMSVRGKLRGTFNIQSNLNITIVEKNVEIFRITCLSLAVFL